MENENLATKIGNFVERHHLIKNTANAGAIFITLTTAGCAGFTNRRSIYPIVLPAEPMPDNRILPSPTPDQPHTCANEGNKVCAGPNNSCQDNIVGGQVGFRCVEKGSNPPQVIPPTPLVPWVRPYDQECFANLGPNTCGRGTYCRAAGYDPSTNIEGAGDCQPLHIPAGSSKVNMPQLVVTP